MADYLFRPKARNDFEDIWNYTREVWGIVQARHYAEGLRDVCTNLAGSPDLGKTRDELYPGLRVYPAGRHLIFYLAMENGIDIVRILHQSMDSELHLP